MELHELTLVVSVNFFGEIRRSQPFFAKKLSRLARLRLSFAWSGVALKRRGTSQG